ncbi:MAG: amino acid ABC transporter substrate-binding protein [Planctomycetes bacterium]|nr:amino acid ABC transporter substrate-binding protein [Planctomycetota bacterium]
MTRFSLACLVLLAAACSAPREAELPEPAVLVVGSDLDNAPFAALDPYERPIGRDVEMMEKLADELGYVLEWRRMPFDQLFDAVLEQEVDVVCATIGITEERAERMAFSRPYFETSIAVVARAGDGEPKSLAELAGRRVAGGKGTTSERAVRLHLADSRGVFDDKSGLSAAERLRSRSVDAIAMDAPAADALVAAGAGAFVKLDPPLERERYALVLHRDRWVLRSRLDAALDKLGRDGELAELDRAHGLAR